MQEYINSGILEAYVLGCASEQEVQEVLHMKEKHPEVKEALLTLEGDMEKIAASMAIEPPAHIWPKIKDEIDEITLRHPSEPQIYRKQQQNNDQAGNNKPHYIDIEAESTHMRIHKAWRWVFAAVFVLGKIFLGFAIYYYLENRQMNEQLKELKTELKQLKSIK